MDSFRQRRACAACAACDAICAMTRWSGVASYTERSCPSAETRGAQRRYGRDALRLRCCLSFVAKSKTRQINTFYVIYHLNNPTGLDWKAFFLYFFLLYIYIFKTRFTVKMAGIDTIGCPQHSALIQSAVSTVYLYKE